MRRLLVAALVLVVLGTAYPAAASSGGQTDLINRIDRVTAVARRPLDPQLSPEAFRERVERRLALIDAVLADARMVAEGEVQEGIPILARVPALPADEVFSEIPGVGLVADDGAGLAELQGHIDRSTHLRAAVRELRVARDALRLEIGLIALYDDLGRSCPVAGPVRFEDTWGADRGWRGHKGVDMVADDGTPLVAVERGVVVQAGWHWAGGNGLYVIGDLTGDVFYYAHLSDLADGIRAGTPVEAGTLLGWVGTTGNADIPHLHLGWMPGTGKVDLAHLDNAYELMVSLCG
ncbi:M23 family metallopeptidase [bacterium]|nr:M23 family metallopeptidase [bacterium]